MLTINRLAQPTARQALLNHALARNTGNSPGTERSYLAPDYRINSPIAFDGLSFPSKNNLAPAHLCLILWLKIGPNCTHSLTGNLSVLIGVGARDRREDTEASRAARITTIAGAVRTILESIGEDPDREGLLKTPERYAKALMFFSKGYEESVTREYSLTFVHARQEFDTDRLELKIFTFLCVLCLCRSDEPGLVPGRYVCLSYHS